MKKIEAIIKPYRLEDVKQEVLSLVRRVAGSDATVLIRGESGTWRPTMTLRRIQATET